MSKKTIVVCCFILLVLLCAGAVMNERIASKRDPHKVQTLRMQSNDPTVRGASFMPREYIRVIRHRKAPDGDSSDGMAEPAVIPYRTTAALPSHASIARR